MTRAPLSAAFDALAMHIAVEKAILESGGSIVASFELDDQGRTVGRGFSGGVRNYRCNNCGERGHNRKRCNGEGKPPKPLWRETKGKP